MHILTKNAPLNLTCKTRHNGLTHQTHTEKSAPQNQQERSHFFIMYLHFLKILISHFLDIQIRVLVIKTQHPAAGCQDTQLDCLCNVTAHSLIQHSGNEAACERITGTGIIVHLVLVKLFVTNGTDHALSIFEA